MNAFISGAADWSERIRRSIGIDLSVTSKIRLAVAEGSKALSNRAVRSSPQELIRAIEAGTHALVLYLALLCWNLDRHGSNFATDNRSVDGLTWHIDRLAADA